MLAHEPILYHQIAHLQCYQTIQVAHEGREALPGVLAIGLALGVGQTLQHGRGFV